MPPQNLNPDPKENPMRTLATPLSFLLLAGTAFADPTEIVIQRLFLPLGVA